MCTYATVHAPVSGSAKGPGSDWFALDEAVVYFDHPVHAMAEHTLNIDLADPTSTSGQRVALELTASAARALAAAITSALDAVPGSLTR